MYLCMCTCVTCFILLRVYETCTEVKLAMQYISQTGILTPCIKIKTDKWTTEHQRNSVYDIKVFYLATFSITEILLC